MDIFFEIQRLGVKYTLTATKEETVFSLLQRVKDIAGEKGQVRLYHHAGRMLATNKDGEVSTKTKVKECGFENHVSNARNPYILTMVCEIGDSAEFERPAFPSRREARKSLAKCACINQL